MQDGALVFARRRRPPTAAARRIRRSPTTVTPDTIKCAVTVAWVVRDGKAAIARFAPAARKEPGLDLLTVHQDARNPGRFMFSEIFADEAAFAAHQTTPHFKDPILGQALGLLAQRRRTACTLP